jgi:cyclic beta-1,2-glucan synthetase
LMGTGDWNDGMNRVGHLGHGESVWLGFFSFDVLQQFAVTAQLQGDPAFAQRCTRQAALLQASLEEHAWDGSWYRRAWFDDGQVLGSANNDECRIDSISQSWSVLSGAASPTRRRTAMASFEQHLVRPDTGAVLLLDPPFDTGSLEPGYIKGYVPGVRENGGQYTHAAVWAGMAFAELGDDIRAWRLLNMINPAGHEVAKRLETYKVEPYVMAADVYGTPPHAGRGGWTWYTGSAGWTYRFIVESLLGVRRVGTALHIVPLLAQGWPGYTLRYRYGATHYHIHVRPGTSTAASVTLDGELLGNDALELLDDGREHQVVVTCPVKAQQPETPGWDRTVETDLER